MRIFGLTISLGFLLSISSCKEYKESPTMHEEVKTDIDSTFWQIVYFKMFDDTLYSVSDSGSRYFVSFNKEFLMTACVYNDSTILGRKADVLWKPIDTFNHYYCLSKLGLDDTTVIKASDLEMRLPVLDRNKLDKGLKIGDCVVKNSYVKLKRIFLKDKDYSIVVPLKQKASDTVIHGRLSFN